MPPSKIWKNWNTKTKNHAHRPCGQGFFCGQGQFSSSCVEVPHSLYHTCIFSTNNYFSNVLISTIAEHQMWRIIQNKNDPAWDVQLAQIFGNYLICILSSNTRYTPITEVPRISISCVQNFSPEIKFILKCLAFKYVHLATGTQIIFSNLTHINVYKYTFIYLYISFSAILL